MQSEFLQDYLGVMRQLFELFVGSVGPRKFDQFDFLELMLPDNSAHILAIGTSFAAEAGSVSRERNRQATCVENFVTVKIGDWDFRSGNQPEIFFAMGDAEKVRGEFR